MDEKKAHTSARSRRVVSTPLYSAMSFLVPAKITSKLPFSRFKTLEESRDFLLQQRYETLMPLSLLRATTSVWSMRTDSLIDRILCFLSDFCRKAAFQRAGKSMFRITTREKKNGFAYEVANGNDLDAIHAGQVCDSFSSALQPTV